MRIWETSGSSDIFLPKESKIRLSSVQGGNCGVEEHRGVTGWKDELSQLKGCGRPSLVMQRMGPIVWPLAPPGERGWLQEWPFCFSRC